jgi:universal stress protein E
MKTYQHIIVGLDFSPASRAALRTAVRFASFSGTPVTAVHVMDPRLATAIKEAHGFSDEALYEHVSESAKTFMTQSDAGTQLVKVEIDMGHPLEKLSAACQRHQAGLLVLGTRGTEHGPNQIGAVAVKCLRKAPADVLLVREELTTPFRRITACVDFSETSAKAVRAARVIAEHDHSDLSCLFIYQSALALSLDYGGFMSQLPVLDNDASENWEKEVHGFVEPLLRTSEGLDWKCKVMERVNIRNAIMEHIAATRTDLVVLGTRGKSDLRTLFIGTTAEIIVSHAPCSILAVKPENFREPDLPPAATPAP